MQDRESWLKKKDIQVCGRAKIEQKTNQFQAMEEGFPIGSVSRKGGANRSGLSFVARVEEVTSCGGG